MFAAPAAFFAGIAFGIMFTALGLLADERQLTDNGKRAAQSVMRFLSE